jgi:hypothetical protein
MAFFPSLTNERHPRQQPQPTLKRRRPASCLLLLVSLSPCLLVPSLPSLLIPFCQLFLLKLSNSPDRQTTEFLVRLCSCSTSTRPVMCALCPVLHARRWLHSVFLWLSAGLIGLP